MNDDNMIPLINVVFLLLIFFLVAGQIATHDSAEFSAPTSSREQPLEKFDITILIAADNSIWVNNEAVQDDLSAYMNSQEFTDESRVVLKVDAYLNASILDPVVASLQSLGIQHLKLVTVTAP